MRGLRAALIAIAVGLPCAALAQAQVGIVLKKRVIANTVLVEGWAFSHEVRGLKAGGDGFLAGRAGPAPSFAERDRLTNGRTVIVFETKGQWAGVIYPPKPEYELEAIATACGFDEAAARAMPARKTYDGPCAWGWVNRRWLVNLSD